MTRVHANLDLPGESTFQVPEFPVSDAASWPMLDVALLIASTAYCILVVLHFNEGWRRYGWKKVSVIGAKGAAMPRDSDGWLVNRWRDSFCPKIYLIFFSMSADNADFSEQPIKSNLLQTKWKNVGASRRAICRTSPTPLQGIHCKTIPRPVTYPVNVHFRRAV